MFLLIYDKLLEILFFLLKNPQIKKLTIDSDWY